MLSQLQKLSIETEGRYATDDELAIITEYMQAFHARVEVYEALVKAEGKIIQEVFETIEAKHPEVFRGSKNLKDKWKTDTIRVLRYTAVAMLMNDPKTVRERFLAWFQTVMRAFSAQASCDITYRVMESVMARHLTAEGMALVQPFLELNRQVLGQSS
ncbi:phycobilisome protein [Leptolyngbya sp. FACHB-16]|uniref:phycobilisome protein n=1 Tax=unclassified Leptolyngbya TaxID=2650499 RepID=UPI0016843BC3|nr:phycobilisome protein [Leptolyngbya sp. FACHB-16]MBD2154639.1 phycobilisome protein [Leptolyngbya sp. FACHB-16]